MQRGKLLGARRIETPPGTFTSVSNPSSAPPSSTMASNNQSWSQDANYGGVKLYNPNEMAQQQPLNVSYQPNQQEQNLWPNQDPNVVNQRGYDQNAYNWSNAAVSTSSSSSFASQQHYNSQPMYEQQQQQTPQVTWNVSQDQQQASMYSSFNDTWNWGTGDESSDVSGQNSFESQVNQQPREVPDGHDQGFTGYQGWNSGQQQQQTSYVWPGGIQTSSDSESVVTSSVVSQNSNAWNQSHVTSSQVSFTSLAAHETNGETSIVDRNEVNGNGIELRTEVVGSVASANVADGVAARDEYVDDNTVSTFFSRTSEEREPVTMSESDVSRSNRSEVDTEGAIDQHNIPTFTGEQPFSVWNHVPYIRADSCISNSSLMTYNRSVAGSQELLSGSFYGDESTSLVSLSGLSQAVEDLHLSSRSHPHLNQLKHPLHQSYPQNRLLDHIGDSSEVCESLPILADRKMVSASVSPSKLVRRLSVPNALISANKEVVKEVKDETSNVDEDEESATNVEVLPSVAQETALESSSSVPLAENAEIIDSKAKLTSELWSHENSAFQPLPSRTSSTVFQQEIPDGVESASEQPINNDIDVPLTTEGANLETVPDNVERPLDTDLSEDGKSTLIPTRSTLHSIVARQRTRDIIGGSPSTALWENPDLVSVRGFEMVLAPAVVSPQPQPSPAPPQGGALLVPQLSHQQELLDNPLGLVSTPTSKKEEPLSARGVERDVNCLKLDAQMTSERDFESVQKQPFRQQETSNVIPLDLSSRAAPQGQSAAEEDVGISLRRSLRGVGESASQTRDVSSPNSVASRPEEDVNRRHGPYPDLPDQDRGRRQWSEPRDDREGPQGSWESRRRYSIGRDEGWDYRDRGGSGRRRADYPPENDRRWAEDRSRDYDRSRDVASYPPQPPSAPHDDPYYGYRDRDRSRPSSRSSTQDYDSRDSIRPRYPDQRQYPLPDDGRQPPPPQPPRPSSRGGYESDQDARRRRQAPEYDYYRDPRYAGYENYYQYSRDPRYDPRQYPNPYYNANSYNYGYYAELYGNDPRYTAYYESLANYSRYAAAAAGQYGYEDYDRRSVHSGRSSVTDDSQLGRGEPMSNAFHRDSPSETVQQPSAIDQSTIYPYDGSSYYQTDSSQVVEFNQSQTGYVETPPQRLTPAKFSTPHVRATFNDSGQLVIVPPNNIADGHVAQVEICDLQSVLSNDPIAKELENFPGPLIRCDTHKNDVIQFCLQKVRKAKEDASIPDRESCVLIWELLVLLIRQNGVVVGTDIAELLLSDPDSVGSNMSLETELVDKSGENSNINSPDEGVVITRDFSATNLSTLSSEEHVTKKFREFLLFGHKKDALEWAMKHRLWGHALFLASKMDTRTYAMVMTRFANSLALNDPLQSLYQLMSGRQPAAVTCIADEKWGDWRPHLAMILSNSSPRPDLDRRSVVALGDTLAARGCLHASHFCYLMAQMDFGTFAKKSSKLVLIGSNHSLPFIRFATNEAIQCTEVYEYVQSLANPQFILPSLQVFKYLYAIRLAEFGQFQEALHYCEVIALTIQKAPAQFNAELVHRVYQLGYRLKYYDPYYSQAEEMGNPSWLCDLGNILNAFSEGTIQQYPDLTEHQSHVEPSSVPSSYADYSGVDASVTNTSLQQAASNVQQFSNSVTQDSQDSHSELNTSANDSQQYQGYGETYQQQNNVYSNYGGGQQPVIQSGGGGEIVHQPLGSYQEPQQNQYGVGGGGAVPNVHDTVPPLTRRDSTDYYGASTRKNSLSMTSGHSYDHQKRKSSGDWSAATASNNDVALSKPDSTKKPLSIEKTKVKQGSWLGGIFGRFSLKPKNQMILPEDKNPAIVWDPDAGRWMNTEGEDEADNAGPIAPPKDMELTSSPPKPFSGVPTQDPMAFNAAPSFNNTGPTSVPTSLPPVSSAQGNRFKLKHGRGMRQNYVDVLSGNTVPVNSSVPSIVPQAVTQMPTQYFVPAPVSDIDGGAMDFVTPTMTIGQSRVANPASRSGSPQQFGSESSEEVGKTEAVGQGRQPLMYDTTSMSSNHQMGGASGGLHKKYGGRYPR